MMLDDKQLQALLRLKRFEQPPPGYFDTALQQLHRRQRVDLLRESPWRIWVERVASSLWGFRMPSYAYGGVFAAFMVTSTLLWTGVVGPRSGVPAGSLVSAVVHGNRGNERLSLNRDFKWTESEPARPRLVPALQPSRTALPRYILDGRPVSFEPSTSF